MKTISRYIMTLALLLTAVTGAWAQSAVASIGSENYTTLQAAFTAAETGQTIKLLSDVTQTGGVGKSDGKAVTFDLNGHIYTCTDDYSVMATYNSQITIIDSSTGTPGGIKSVLALAGQENGKIIIKAGRYNIGDLTAEELLEYFPLWCVEMYSGYTLQDITPADAQGFCVGVVAPAPSGPKVAWDKDKKTGTFDMPGSDVVLTPIYAKAAAFATTGTGSEAKTLLPEAAEGVIAGTDASLIAEGTGIVAFAAASTDVTQGTLMYAIGTSATEAPELTAFNATVPTAKTVADDGADVLVWYYIQGADAPEGEAATLDNTFSDTEPACLTVQVLSNKYDITFNAANANTIEAGKATVTVGGTDKTVTEGKLEGVKMGSEVKLEAKPGYKFRKVEVKKGASTPSLNITSPAVGQIIGSDGKNYAYGSLPTGVTAVAKICYVSGSHGLALALTDEEGEMNWSTAQTTCASHTPAFTGGTWKLATKDEWDNMISTAGSFTDLREGFVDWGGTDMQSACYWSSSEDDSDYAWGYGFDFGFWSGVSKVFGYSVRACLAF